MNFQFSILNFQFIILPLHPQNGQGSLPANAESSLSAEHSRSSPLKMGKSCTTSSLGILQDGNVAKVLGCSGAIQTACPPASLAQLARARDL